MGAVQTTQEFLGLTREQDDHRLVMKPSLMGGGSGSLFGGVGVAAGIVALQVVTDQPVVYLSCQFASKAEPPEELRIGTEILASGRTVSQARLTGMVGDRTVLNLMGATGMRTEEYPGTWRPMPDAPAPEELESMARSMDVEMFHQHTEIRMAHGSFGFSPEETPGRGVSTGEHRTLFWVRMSNVAHDAAAIALLADYLPSAVGSVLGGQVFCSSLDNTIRFAGPIEVDETSDWVLCESHVDYVGNGFGTNRGMLWRRDGTPLAVANQSVIVAKPRF